MSAQELFAAVEVVLGKCENYFPTDVTCSNSGRDIESPYSAENYCLPCRVRAVLNGARPNIREAQRDDGLSRCQTVHPEHGQCRGIADIGGHQHYGPRNKIWQAS